ncbi:MAG TPA: hypothetical protein VFP94_07500, partial [Terriglobales bacterium]|nr:hypothetical protein [Terriglobales bacterium]
MTPTNRDPRRYAQAKLRLSWVDGGIKLVLLILFLTSGWSVALARWCSSASWLGVLEYVLLLGAGFSLLGLPGDWIGRRIEVGYGMNRQSVGGWVKDQLKGAALGAGLGVAGAELLYWLLRAAPRHWWLWGWAGYLVIMVGLVQLGPVLLLPIFFKLRRMSADDPGDAALVERLESTYAGLRARNPKLPRLHGIYEWKLGE